MKEIFAGTVTHSPLPGYIISTSTNESSTHTVSVEKAKGGPGGGVLASGNNAMYTLQLHMRFFAFQVRGNRYLHHRVLLPRSWHRYCWCGYGCGASSRLIGRTDGVFKQGAPSDSSRLKS